MDNDEKKEMIFIDRRANIFVMTLKPIATLLSIFIIVLPLGIPFILKMLQIEPLSDSHVFILGVSVAIVMLFLALPFLFVFMTVKYDKHELTTKLGNLTNQLEESIKRCGVLTTHIEDCPRLPGQNIVEKSYLMSKSDFFKCLDKARNQASDNTEIRLMNFARSITKQKKEIDNVEQYYENEIDYCNKNRDKVTLYRIVSIHTKDKFDYCIKLANEAWEKKLPNLNLAYLYIDDFNEKLPKITGVQIIGDDEVILMDPRHARPSNTNFLPPIFLKSKEIADIYSEYYKKLWDEIEAYHRQWPNNKINNEGYIGHILYGENGIAPDSVWIEINKKMEDSQQLNNEELRKIGIKNLSGNFTHEKPIKNNTSLSLIRRLFGIQEDIKKNKSGSHTTNDIPKD